MAIKVNRWLLQVVFSEPVLGTLQLNPEIFGEYISNEETGDDEAVTLANAIAHDSSNDGAEAEAEKPIGKTGFHRDEDGCPILYDYVV